MCKNQGLDPLIFIVDLGSGSRMLLFYRGSIEDPDPNPDPVPGKNLVLDGRKGQLHEESVKLKYFNGFSNFKVPYL
jgi:hypothetical protein